MQNFTEDQRALIGRVQSLRKDLADWRDRAALKTEDYTKQLKEIQDELLKSMESLKDDVSAMRSKVRVALDKHDPSWREKETERR